MNFSRNLRITFRSITASRDGLIRILNYFFALFYFVSFLGKVLDFEAWFEFHFGILNHWIGYVNGFLILALEFYFVVRFLLGRIDTNFIDFNLIFIGFLTGVVALFPNLFKESCMCFGRLFEFSAGFGFFAKNTALISLLFLQRNLVAKRGENNHFK